MTRDDLLRAATRFTIGDYVVERIVSDSASPAAWEVRHARGSHCSACGHWRANAITWLTRGTLKECIDWAEAKGKGEVVSR